MPVARAETVIAAPPSAVWAALMDLPSWPRWAHFHPTAHGPIAVGTRVTVRFPIGRIIVPGRARFVRVEPERALWWRGGVPGVIGAEHGFELTPEGAGTRLLHEERFLGVLAAPAMALTGIGQEAKYAAVNEALRAIVEGAV